MKVDLNTCKPGDILISCRGERLTYVGRDEKLTPFPHKVKYDDLSEGSRSDDGQVFLKKKLPTDHDIVEIIHLQSTENMVTINYEGEGITVTIPRINVNTLVFYIFRIVMGTLFAEEDHTEDDYIFTFKSTDAETYIYNAIAKILALEIETVK